MSVDFCKEPIKAIEQIIQKALRIPNSYRYNASDEVCACIYEIENCIDKDALSKALTDVILSSSFNSDLLHKSKSNKDYSKSDYVDLAMTSFKHNRKYQIFCSFFEFNDVLDQCYIDFLKISKANKAE